MAAILVVLKQSTPIDEVLQPFLLQNPLLY